MRTTLVALTLSLGACGGDDAVDLTGVYRVDSSVGSQPCGVDADVTVSPYLLFKKDEIFGQSYFAYEGCTDEAGTTCGSSGGLFGGLFEPIDGGWRGVITSSSGSGGRCSLGYREETALLDGTVLAIEENNYGETVDLTEDKCDPDEAERRGDGMPCLEHARITATRIGPGPAPE